MIAALDDAAAFDHENLIGAADRGKPVSDDKGGAALHELSEAGLDHPFGLGVERTGSLVKNEDARLGQQRPGDG